MKLKFHYTSLRQAPSAFIANDEKKNLQLQA
jgi:hypothetical protein